MAASEDHQVYTVPFTNDLLVDIHIPPELKGGRHPLVINWHGGGLITGSRYFKDLFPPWLIPWATKNNAIVVSPDYRKIPEARGVDIIDDIESFWTWLQARFGQHLDEISSGKHQADLNHILLSGGSAGGWTALHLALSHPDQIRAVSVRFPMIVIDRTPRPPYTGPNPEFLGFPLWSEEKLNEELAKIKRPSVFTEGGWDRIGFFSAFKFGVIGDWIGTEAKLDLFERVKAGGKLPKRLWITHGVNDSVIPVEGTREFVAAVQQHCPSTELRVKYYDGDHAWDLTKPELATEVEAGLDWVKTAWLGD